jgi:hypothetical protein
MSLKVVKNHGVVASDDQLSLSTVDLTLEQKAHIRMLCEQRLQSFVQKRGIEIWDYRLLDEEPIPDCFRYLVFKAGRALSVVWDCSQGRSTRCRSHYPSLSRWEDRIGNF